MIAASMIVSPQTERDVAALERELGGLVHDDAEIDLLEREKCLVVMVHTATERDRVFHALKRHAEFVGTPLVESDTDPIHTLDLEGEYASMDSAQL